MQFGRLLVLPVAPPPPPPPPSADAEHPRDAPASDAAEDGPLMLLALHGADSADWEDLQEKASQRWLTCAYSYLKWVDTGSSDRKALVAVGSSNAGEDGSETLHATEEREEMKAQWSCGRYLQRRGYYTT